MLDKWRKDIDETDKAIIELIAKRMGIVKAIWKYKKENSIEVVQKWRWQEVLKDRKAIASELGLEESFIEDVWNRFHEYAIELEKKED